MYGLRRSIGLSPLICNSRTTSRYKGSPMARSRACLRSRKGQRRRHCRLYALNDTDRVELSYAASNAHPGAAGAPRFPERSSEAESDRESWD